MRKLIATCVCALLIFGGKAQDSLRWMPDQFGIQLAGSTGQVALSADYKIIREKCRAGVSLGFVGASLGGPMGVAAARFQYLPFQLEIGDKLSIVPVAPQFFLSYAVADDYRLLWPRDRYPPFYYWWSEALRIHLGLRSYINLKVGAAEGGKQRVISIYTDFNTNDLYLASWYPNRDAISMGDIVRLGIGVLYAPRL